MKYSVNYGVNNSHMCEAKIFSLYKDALEFFNDLDNQFESKVIYKLHYNQNGYVNSLEHKKFKFESGTDNTRMLESLRGLI